jgi:hypothetical protein
MTHICPMATLKGLVTADLTFQQNIYDNLFSLIMKKEIIKKNKHYKVTKSITSHQFPCTCIDVKFLVWSRLSVNRSRNIKYSKIAPGDEHFEGWSFVDILSDVLKIETKNIVKKIN